MIKKILKRAVTLVRSFAHGGFLIVDVAGGIMG